jgi:hypothetical protein
MKVNFASYSTGTLGKGHLFVQIEVAGTGTDDAEYAEIRRVSVEKEYEDRSAKTESLTSGDAE